MGMSDAQAGHPARPIKTLADASDTVRRLADADVALAVKSNVTPTGIDGSAVLAEIETALLIPGRAGAQRHTGSRQTWKTDINEVRRLAGLAALNLTRLELLKLKQEGS